MLCPITRETDNPLPIITGLSNCPPYILSPLTIWLDHQSQMITASISPWSWLNKKRSLKSRSIIFSSRPVNNIWPSILKFRNVKNTRIVGRTGVRRPPKSLKRSNLGGFARSIKKRFIVYSVTLYSIKLFSPINFASIKFCSRFGIFDSLVVIYRRIRYKWT